MKLFLDTETTGFGPDARVVELGLIDQDGKVLIDTLINPGIKMPAEAQSIHGISDADLVDAPTFDQVWHDLQSFIDEADELIIYNKDYDIRLIKQSSPYEIELSSINVRCLMLEYAEFYDEKKENGEYKWQKLVNAAAQQNIDISDLTAHRAVSDCEITRRLDAAIAD
jgi:DNA polymerase III subunit epsilon